MKKIILLLFTMPLFIYFLTCDRADMQTIAKYGPEPDVIYFFTDGSTSYDGTFTGYDGPRQACLEVYEMYFSSLDITRIEPLLSTSERDVRDIVPDIYSHVEVIGVDTGQTPYLISYSWNGLWDGSLDGPVNTITSINYWTGSTESGTLSTANCDNWSNPGATGEEGDGSDIFSWMENGAIGCTGAGDAGLICVGY